MSEIGILRQVGTIPVPNGRQSVCFGYHFPESRLWTIVITRASRGDRSKLYRIIGVPHSVPIVEGSNDTVVASGRREQVERSAVQLPHSSKHFGQGFRAE